MSENLPLILSEYGEFEGGWDLPDGVDEETINDILPESELTESDIYTALKGIASVLDDDMLATFLFNDEFTFAPNIDTSGSDWWDDAEFSQDIATRA